MKKLSRKMMISLLAFVLAFVALGASTYAWFTLADKAELSNLEMNVSLGEGLDISFDGVTYQSNLSKEAIEEKIGGKKLSDITTTDGINFKNLAGDSSSEYIQLHLYFRASGIDATKAANGVGVYLDSLNNDASYTTDKQTGTFVVSQGVELDPTTSYRAEADGELVDEALKYYASDAIRVSFVEDESLLALYDFNAKEGRNYNDGFVANANKVDAEGLYGAASYYFAKQGKNVGVGAGTVESTTLEFTELTSEQNAMMANNNNSLICNLEAGDDGFYYGEVTINIWIEGWDTDCFNVILTDKVMTQFSFALGYKAE